MQRERGRWYLFPARTCSMYTRMVAPEEPVPERRKMMRLPSEKTKRSPCFEATEPSIGSVYCGADTRTRGHADTRGRVSVCGGLLGSE